MIIVYTAVHLKTRLINAHQVGLLVLTNAHHFTWVDVEVRPGARLPDSESSP